jgi:hypothetical protein
MADILLWRQVFYSSIQQFKGQFCLNFIDKKQRDIALVSTNDSARSCIYVELVQVFTSPSHSPEAHLAECLTAYLNTYSLDYSLKRRCPFHDSSFSGVSYPEGVFHVTYFTARQAQRLCHSSPLAGDRFNADNNGVRFFGAETENAGHA